MRRLEYRQLPSLRSVVRSSVVHASGANFVIVGLTMLSGVLVARSLGAEGRGHYAAIMAWFGVALVLGEVGQSAAVTFHVARHARWGKDLIKTSRMLMGAAGVLVTVLGLGAADLLAEGDSEVAAAYRASFIGCLINGFGAPYLYAMQAISIRTWNGLRLIQPVIYLGLVFIAVVTGRLDLFSLSLILVASTGGQLLLAWHACHRLNFTSGQVKPQLRSSLLKYGLAYSASSLPSAASAQLDKIALSRMVPASDLGLYAVATTMASMAYPFSTAIASVTFPRIARRDIGHESRRSLEDASLALTLAVSLLVSSAVALAAQWAIPWLFGEQFRGAAVLTWWLVPAMVLRCCSQVVAAHLRGRGRPGSVSWAQVGGLLGAAIGILTLTPVHGMAGTALGIAASELLVLGWTYVVLVRVRGRRGSSDQSSPAPTRQASGLDGRL